MSKCFSKADVLSTPKQTFLEVTNMLKVPLSINKLPKKAFKENSMLSYI